VLLQASAHAIPLRDETVQCVVTSPPYWGLREYDGAQTIRWADGVSTALGWERRIEEYVEHVVEVFREVARVLRPDGTVWLNLGDSYAAKARGSDAGWDKSRLSNPGSSQKAQAASMRRLWERHRGKASGLHHKDLVLMPFRVALALQADGWIVRSDVVWHKSNPMPESVTDRPTKVHEYLFLMSKGERYFYDADAIKDPASPGTHARISQPTLDEQTGGPKQDAFELNAPGRRKHDRRPNEIVQALGRKAGVNPKAAVNHPGSKQNASFSAAVTEPVPMVNSRSVWTIATTPFPGAHYATYPVELAEKCVLAGSAREACGECGAPWARVVERTAMRIAKSENRKALADAGASSSARTVPSGTMIEPPTSKTIGWQSTCEHDDPSGRSVVLDPFAGTSTTGVAALRNGRAYVGLDLSRTYLVEHSRERLRGVVTAVHERLFD